jgi:hypothetical protein
VWRKSWAHLLEGGAVGAGAADGLGEDPVAAGALQGVDLELGLLVSGGDAGVAKQVSHAPTVSQPSDTGGCVTLISDTGSGRPPSGFWRGSGGCRRNDSLMSHRLNRRPSLAGGACGVISPLTSQGWRWTGG